MEILNQTGATIIIEEVYMKKTYAGLLAGTPLMATRHILEDITRIGLPVGWGKYPIVAIGLSEFAQETNRPLPPFAVAAFIVSMRVKDTDSVLVAVWFQDQQFAPPPVAVLEELRSLDWERLSAAEYYYG